MLKEILSKAKLPSIIVDLANNSKNYTIGQIFLQGFGIITLPIFTRLLSVDDYGVVSLFLYTNGVIVVIYSLGIGHPINRYYYEKKQDFGELLFTAISFLFIFQIIVLSAGIIYSKELEYFIGLPKDLIVLAFCTSFFIPLIRVYQNLNICMEKSVSYTSFQISRRIVIFLSCVILIYLLPYDPYYGRIIGELFIIPFFLFTLFKLYKIIQLKFSIRHIKYIFRIAMPLFPVMVAGIIFGQIDRVVINKYLGVSDTGLYSYAYAISSLPGIFIVSIKSAWEPKLMKLLKMKNFHLINNITALMITVYSFFMGLIIIFCQDISLLLAPNSYQAGVYITPLLIFSVFIATHESIYHGYIIFKKKLLFSIALITIFVGILKLVLNIILIPQYGYIAAAYSSCISYLVSLCFTYSVAKYLYGNSIYKLQYSIKQLLIILLSMIVYYCIYLTQTDLIVNILIKIICIALLMLSSFMIIKKYLNTVQSLEIE